VRKALIVLGWLGATAATTLVAYLAVDAAGSRVGDSPLAVVVAADSASSTVANVSTSTSTTSSPATTTTTSASGSTSPTTAPNGFGWEQQTINSVAGKVVISYRPGEVRLESVAPLVGYGFEVEDSGPSEVRVEFEGPLRVEVRVRWRDGQLVTEIDEDS
jgi:hypothetical protein